MSNYPKINREYCDDTALQRWEGEGGCVGRAQFYNGDYAGEQESSSNGARPVCATSMPHAAAFAHAPFPRKPFSLPRVIRRNRSNRRQRRLPAVAGV